MRAKILSALAGLASIAVAFAEENATTTTTTTTTTASTIDLSIIVPVVNQILPVILIIGVISALFKAFGRIAISKIHNVPAVFTKIKPYLPAIFTIVILCIGIVTGVYADDYVSMDMSGLANMLVSLMISLLPLLFVLMIFKAIMGAFSDALK